MDRVNLTDLEAICPSGYSGELKLFLDFGSSGIDDVPDPYYGGRRGFDEVYEMLLRSSEELLAFVREEHKI